MQLNVTPASCGSSSYLVAVAEAVSLRGALTQDEEQAAAEAGGCVRVVAQLLRNAVHRAEPDPRHLCKGTAGREEAKSGG
jgi:hypothetical protein